jgi:hypothetical protein
MPGIDGYVIVTAEGRIKKPRGHSAASFYTVLSRAQAQAKRPGDSVVAVTVDLERQPVFIRSLKL